MNNYENLTDEEIITLYRDGDEAAAEFIMMKYKELVRNLAGSMYILGGDTEDLIQEGMIGLFKAIREYDSGRDASFKTFARLCVSRQIYSAVKLSGRKKHMPLNTYVSFYNSASENTDSERTVFLGDTLAADKELEPESVILNQEKAEEISQAIENELSALEKSVLELYLTGMGYTEIAKVLGRDDKSTDNALQRIRLKLKKYI